MKWIVYCTTCLVNGKIYIGVHKTENPDIFDGYYGNGLEKGWGIKNPENAFQRAIKKYGYSNFRRSILYVFDNEDDAYNKEAEIVTLDFIKRRDNYNTALGGQHPGCRQKWIYRYDLNGNFIEEYYGIMELGKKWGCNYMNFTNAVNLKRSYKNSYWSFEKVEKLNISEYRLNYFSNIYQYDLEGNYIKEWESIGDICKELGLTKSNIYTSIDRMTSAGGFYFTKEKDKIYDILKTKELYNQLPKIKPGQCRKIAQYDLDGNLVKIWNSTGECRKEFSKCLTVAKGIIKQTKGFIFKYVE